MAVMRSTEEKRSASADMRRVVAVVVLRLFRYVLFCVPHYISRVLMLHIYEYECVGVCARAESRKTEKCNCSVRIVIKRMMRRVQRVSTNILYIPY